jgi:hypothetical protein
LCFHASQRSSSCVLECLQQHQPSQGQQLAQHQQRYRSAQLAQGRKAKLKGQAQLLPRTIWILVSPVGW